MRRFILKPAGFTLIEIVLVLVIGSLIFGLAFIGWRQTRTSQDVDRAKTDAQRFMSELNRFAANNSGSYPGDSISWCIENWGIPRTTPLTSANCYKGGNPGCFSGDSAPNSYRTMMSQFILKYLPNTADSGILFYKSQTAEDKVYSCADRFNSRIGFGGGDFYFYRRGFKCAQTTGPYNFSSGTNEYKEWGPMISLDRQSNWQNSYSSVKTEAALVMGIASRNLVICQDTQ